MNFDSPKIPKQYFFQIAEMCVKLKTIANLVYQTTH